VSEEKPVQPKICGYIDIWPGLPINSEHSSYMISMNPGELTEGCTRIYVEIPLPLEVFNAVAGVEGTARIRNVTEDPPKNILT
jgi:hypothetical protein